jgi:pimeloyl-ACP methyl ester carboxylesterase
MYQLLWLVVLIPILMLSIGMVYQWLGARRDQRRYQGLGTMVDVGGGRQIYMSERGSGGPAVIFESGIAATSQNWLRMQESVAEFSRTVTYDRRGLGWSSAAKSERTPSNIARELRDLLQRAGVPGPYVLVGHSFGGLVVRRYAAEYPDEVVGVVLVDAMRPEEWPPVNETQRGHLDRGIRLTGLAVPIARFGLARFATTSQLCRNGKASRWFSRAAGNGGRHVLERITCEVGKMPREVWPIVAAHWSTPHFYHGLAAHLRAVPASVIEMNEAEPIRSAPVVLLTPGNIDPLSSEQLRRIGPDTQQVIAEKSGHWVHLDEPELVLDAIRTMVEQGRAQIREDVGSVMA